jgi:hypothetical protein
VAGELTNWAVNFSNYLDAFGFDNAGLAWGLSHADGLTPERPPKHYRYFNKGIS